MDNGALQQLIEDSCRKFCNELPAEPANLYDPIRYAMASGGKRIRPLLCLITAEMFGADPSKALPPALAVELFHNFSLLHDDIMDKAPMRRGNPSVHAKWNSNIALLSGDALFTQSFRALSGSEAKFLPALLEIFTRTALQVCEGQQMDMDFESRNDVRIPEYMKMVELKTAVLLGAALQMGALSAGADTKEAELLFNFGKHIGIAFQLQDDLLDSFGKQEKVGKRTGGDIVANKKTFLLLKTFELASRYQKEELVNWMQVKDETEKINGIISLFEQLGIREQTVEEITRHTDTALNALAKVKGDTHALRAFADTLMQRNH